MSVYFPPGGLDLSVVMPCDNDLEPRPALTVYVPCSDASPYVGGVGDDCVARIPTEEVGVHADQGDFELLTDGRTVGIENHVDEPQIERLSHAAGGQTVVVVPPLTVEVVYADDRYERQAVDRILYVERLHRSATLRPSDPSADPQLELRGIWQCLGPHRYVQPSMRSGLNSGVLVHYHRVAVRHVQVREPAVPARPYPRRVADSAGIDVVRCSRGQSIVVDIDAVRRTGKRCGCGVRSQDVQVVIVVHVSDVEVDSCARGVPPPLCALGIPL